MSTARERSEAANSAQTRARERRSLTSRGLRALQASAELIEIEADITFDAMTDLRSIDGQLAVASGLLRDRLAAAGKDDDGLLLVQASTALAEVHSVRYLIHDLLIHERLRRFDGLDEGIAELRRILDPNELLNQVCESVAHSCGFDRVMLSRVTDSLWQPWKSYAVGDRPHEQSFRKWIRAIPEIRLDHMMLENEMVRRREPAIVVDGENDPRVYRPLLQASGLTSYVAAPLVPAGRVIGFLHADYESADVVTLDRDLLWAYAEAFSQVFERAVLLTRLRDQREQVLVAMRTVEQVVEDLESAEIALMPHESRGARPTRMPLASVAPMVDASLTARELEVLSLMSTGATNKRIAEMLVITDGTVKSHVKRILRKLRAENRGEAISQYLHVTIGQNQP